MKKFCLWFSTISNVYYFEIKANRDAQLSPTKRDVFAHRKHYIWLHYQERAERGIFFNMRLVHASCICCFKRQIGRSWRIFSFCTIKCPMRQKTQAKNTRNRAPAPEILTINQGIKIEILRNPFQSGTAHSIPIPDTQAATLNSFFGIILHWLLFISKKFSCCLTLPVAFPLHD